MILMRQWSETDGGSLRTGLIAAAARLIATEGAPALTLRRLADEVGTSTMAIYTHFGGMPELRRAVRREGFARLAAQLAEARASDDPVVDLGRLGRVYYANAVGDPDLYRVAFMEQPLDEADAAIGTEAFQALVACVERCIAAGRFTAANATDLATEFWAMGHGVITLQLSHLLTAAQALRCLDAAVLRLVCGFGDDPDAAKRSLQRARRRREQARARLPGIASG
jgi:AcrR family transcriptional regulator